MAVAAVWSNVIDCPDGPGAPFPASDISIESCPPGPTNTMSRSRANVCVSRLSVTVTFEIVPGVPLLTLIVDG